MILCYVNLTTRIKTNPGLWLNTGPGTPTMADADVSPNWLDGLRGYKLKKSGIPCGPELEGHTCCMREAGQLGGWESRQGRGQEQSRVAVTGGGGGILRG